MWDGRAYRRDGLEKQPRTLAHQRWWQLERGPASLRQRIASLRQAMVVGSGPAAVILAKARIHNRRRRHPWRRSRVSMPARAGMTARGADPAKRRDGATTAAYRASRPTIPLPSDKIRPPGRHSSANSGRTPQRQQHQREEPRRPAVQFQQAMEASARSIEPL